MEFEKLIIAEKPKMAMEIAQALLPVAGGGIEKQKGYLVVGGKIAVSSAVGHVIGLAPPEIYEPSLKAYWSLGLLPVIPPKWQLKPHDETRDQLNVVLGLLKQAKEVVHAGDAAREGQIIIDYILHISKYQGPVKRLWLQETTPASIRRAYKAMKPNSDYQNLFHAGIARARIDWLIGMNLTMAYSAADRLKSGNTRMTWHLGRVKTWILCFIAERQRAIAAFVAQPYYLVKATIAVEGGTFDALFAPPAGAPYLSPENRIIDKKAADAIVVKVTGKSGVIAECETVPDKREAPPLPLKLGSLQKLANKVLGLSPKETLAVAQSLYEKHKLISYPRTDFEHMPDDEHAIAHKFLEAAKSNLGAQWDYPGEPDYSIRTSAWNSKKIGDHFGLRPTEVRDYDISTLSKPELAIYKLIVRYYLAQFYPDYLYDSTSVRVEIENEIFRASGTTPKRRGWKALFPEMAAAADASAPSLPLIVAGEVARARDVQTHTEKTKPPQRVTGALVIDIMETAYKYVVDQQLRAEIKEKGVGTPATRAAIVDDLLTQEYLVEATERKQKFYDVTSRGYQLVDMAPAELKTADLTAYFEHLLGKVEQGEMSHEAVVAEQAAYVKKIVDQIRSTAPAEPAPVMCDECGKPMYRRSGRNGPFLGCSGYPACKHVVELAA